MDSAAVGRLHGHARTFGCQSRCRVAWCGATSLLPHLRQLVALRRHRRDSALGRSGRLRRIFRSQDRGPPTRRRCPRHDGRGVAGPLSRIRPAGQRMGNQNSYRRRDPEPRSVGQPGNLCLGAEENGGLNRTRPPHPLSAEPSSRVRRRAHPEPGNSFSAQNPI